MGRKVRMVPSTWEHPKKNGKFIPLLNGPFAPDLANWAEEALQWDNGFRRNYSDNTFAPRTSDETGTYAEWAGECPRQEDYMPEWSADVATFLMMYETTTEGTPISPAFATPEELAHWLADTGASAFGDMTASYDAWLATCKRGWAVSAVMSSAGLQSGVTALEGRPLMTLAEVERAAAEGIRAALASLPIYTVLTDVQQNQRSHSFMVSCGGLDHEVVVIAEDPR